jgi:membrane fusion protein, multidrug efflux system
LKQLNDQSLKAANFSGESRRSTESTLLPAIPRFWKSGCSKKAQRSRARILLSGPAGQQSTYDAAIANQHSLEAQVQAAQAQVQASQINLDYTDIRSPIDGRIGRTAVTEGNVVGPGSGILTTIVSQDPMYVIFPVPVRQGLELRARYSPQGGLGAVVVRLRLPDGRLYDQTGKLDFVDNTVSQSTDTVTVRGVIKNSVLQNPSPTGGPVRELTDGEFVTVLMEGVQPVEVVAIPRAAVLSDQQGDYVFVVGPDNKAEQRRIQLGQSTPVMGSVISGLSAGEKVIVEGLQRVRPGQPVSPGPASQQILATMKAASDDRPHADSGAASQIKPAGNSK